MGKIICVTNQKGGVGKTSSSLNIAGALRTMGRSVLFVDADPQCSSTLTYGISIGEGEESIYDLYESGVEDVYDIIYETSFGDIIPGDKIMKEKETGLNGDPKKLYRLKNALAKIRDDYDYIIIDTNPNTNFSTLSAVMASDGAIVPVTGGYFAQDGLEDVLKSLKGMKEVNPNFKIYGIFINNLDKRRAGDNLADDGLAEKIESIKEELGLDKDEYKPFKTRIRTDQSVENAHRLAPSLFDITGKAFNQSKAKADFMALAKEIEKAVKEG